MTNRLDSSSGAAGRFLLALGGMTRVVVCAKVLLSLLLFPMGYRTRG